MSSRSSLPGSHFSGFPCHHSSLAGTCAPALRSAPASGILTALGSPPGPRAAAAGAAPGAQLPDPRATQNHASSSTRPCQPQGALGVQTPARKICPYCDSTRASPPGSPVPTAATYPGRGPGAGAGGWRRCQGRPVPSTALRGRAAPRRASRLLLRPLPEPRAPDRVPGNECPEPAGSETTPQAGTRATARANTQGRRPEGSASVAGRREPPIYPRSRGTHPTDRAQDFAAVTSTPFPPKLPHTHTHTPGHFRAALGPAHPLPLLGRTWRFISLPQGSRRGWEGTWRGPRCGACGRPWGRPAVNSWSPLGENQSPGPLWNSSFSYFSRLLASWTDQSQH